MKYCTRTVWSALVLLGPLAPRATAADVRVVAVEGEKPAKVQVSDVVRVTGRGIAGATFEAKVDGDGRLEATNVVRRIKDGNPVLGTAVKEFLIKPTRRGKIEVTATVKNPTSDTPTVQKYHIDVE